GWSHVKGAPSHSNDDGLMLATSKVFAVPKIFTLAWPLSLGLPPLQKVGLVLTVCVTSKSNGTALGLTVVASVVARITPPVGLQSTPEPKNPSLQYRSAIALTATNGPLQGPVLPSVVMVKFNTCAASRIVVLCFFILGNTWLHSFVAFRPAMPSSRTVEPHVSLPVTTRLPVPRNDFRSVQEALTVKELLAELHTLVVTPSHVSSK